MIYNLEYELLDSIGRAKKCSHHGIFATMDSVEEAKQTLIKQHGQAIRFNVYIIEDLFTRVSQS